MKFHIHTLFILCLSLLIIQPLDAKEITIKGELTGCRSNTVTIFKHDGVQLKPVKKITVSNNSLNAKVDLPAGFYFIGETERNYKIIVLDKDKEINLKGVCGNFKQLQVNSTENILYQNVITKVNEFQRDFQNLINQSRKALNNPALTKDLTKKLAELDEKKINYLNQYKISNPMLYRMIAVQTYLSFQNKGKSGQGEADYFGQNYISQIDFTDKEYGLVPHLMDRSRSFSTTLTTIGLSNEAQIKYVKAFYTKFPKGSVARKSALAGAMFGFIDKNNSGFAALSDLYIAEFGKENPQVNNFINGKKASMASFIIGGEAPEIVQNSITGEPLSLSSLRGKVVLIDFWASWCRPCRKENPHVKKLYSQYKDKGFDIYAVSLDRKQGAWANAIKVDGLPWHHVSDLKGWSSGAAKLYGVTSIPQTVLIDRNGKILARNLRGPALDQKLAEIFGAQP